MQIKTLLYLIILVASLSGCKGQDPALMTWEHSQFALYNAAFSDDGRFAVVSTVGEDTLFWDLDKNKPLYKWYHGKRGENSILSMDFSPDGNWVITADKKTYVIWNTITGRAMGYWDVESDIIDVAISNKGKYVLLGLEDGRALHINQRNQRRLEVVAHGYEPVAAVDLSHEGSIAVTGGGDHRVLVWDAQTGKQIAAYQHASRVTLVALDNQAEKVFSADNKGGAFVWELRSGKKISRLHLKERQYIISAARFSKNATQLLTGSPGRAISIWDTTAGTHLNSWYAVKQDGWKPRGAIVYAVAFAGDGKSIVTEASNGLGQRWAWRTMEKQ